MKQTIQHTRYLLSLIFILFLSSCDRFDGKLIIANQTNEIIFFYVSETDSISGYSPIRVYNNDTILEESDLIQPNSSMRQYLMGNNVWETYINEKCQDSTLRVFFFQEELITKIPWDTIIEKQLYSRKIENSVSELEKLNWKVAYK